MSSPDDAKPEGTAAERFYRLVWPHRTTVLRTARLLLRDPADADDLAQDVLLKAFRRLDSFAEGTDVRAWLLAILRNARVDRVRAAAARGGGTTLSLDAMEGEPADDRPSVVSDEPAISPQEILEQFSDREVISALHGLPEETRWTLLLVDVQGLDLREAAGVLNVAVGTVKSRLHRGRRALANALAAHAREMRMIRRDAAKVTP